ncbi:CRISPR-associated endonuclease Cas2 [Rosettibacter firmus]|uniref:CRISPR-associated endonuclease Cas2 n=1 Tax=Rosettibacter firmus TaxID=3111522 RepID=UPI00336BC11A
MIHIITYDIEDDKERNRVSKILEGYGIRVQESVFECNLNQKRYEELLLKLRKLAKGNFNIRIYPICKDCFSKSVGIGEVKHYPGLKGYEIV